MKTPRVVSVSGLLAVLAILPATAVGQSHDHHAAGAPADSAVEATMESHEMSPVQSLHMVMSPVRVPTHADSVRALAIADTVRRAIEKYRDVAVAEADGYRRFARNVRGQRIYHYTSRSRALRQMFTFDPTKPTSLLYAPGPNGSLVLVGAMFTAPKRWDASKLDERIPTSIARWHKHVNLCVPGRGEDDRWTERRNGQPVFGPRSPIATREACDAVGGRFAASPFGWMIHVNVFRGTTVGTVYGDPH